MALLQNQIKQGEKHKTQKPKRQKYEFFTKIQSFRESTNRYLRGKKWEKKMNRETILINQYYTLKGLKPQKVKSLLFKELLIGNEAFMNNFELSREKG